MRRRVLAYLAATVLAAALATMASTQAVLVRLAALGVPLPLAVRLETTLHDLLGMGPLYAALVGAGFLVALPVAGLLSGRLLHWRGAKRDALFALAGGVTIAVIVLSMKAWFGITTIAGARSAPGFAAQLACGALGGWFYARLTPPSRRAGGAPA